MEYLECCLTSCVPPKSKIIVILGEEKGNCTPTEELEAKKCTYNNFNCVAVMNVLL